MESARAQLGLRRDLLAFQQLEKLGDAVQRRAQALDPQGERRLLRADVDRARQDDIPGIQLCRQVVPGDRMGGLAGQERPDRGIRARTGRQGTVVQVHPSATGPAQDGFGDGDGVRDAEDPVEGAVLQRLFDRLGGGDDKPLFARPVADRGVPGHDGDDLPALGRQQPSAFDGQTVGAVEKSGWHR